MLLEDNDSKDQDSDSSKIYPLTLATCGRQESESSNVYNRKEKSLGELCRRFLYYYGIEGRGELYLDECTQELGVERRRIYDIINILESFSVIRRRAKNEYHWKGIDWIIHSIEQQIASCVSNIFLCKLCLFKNLPFDLAKINASNPSQGILTSSEP